MPNYRVGSHTRTTSSGKTTRVRTHSRNAEAWREAGKAWVGVAASGAITVALVLQMGLQLVSTVAIIVTAILTVVAGAATTKAVRPQKRRTTSTGSRPKAKARPPQRGQLGPLRQHIERKRARRRARYRKWAKRGKKAYRGGRTVVVGVARISRSLGRRGRAAYTSWRAGRKGA